MSLSTPATNTQSVLEVESRKAKKQGFSAVLFVLLLMLKSRVQGQTGQQTGRKNGRRRTKEPVQSSFAHSRRRGENQGNNLLVVKIKPRKEEEEKAGDDT